MFLVSPIQVSKRVAKRITKMLPKHTYSNVKTQNFPGRSPGPPVLTGGEVHCVIVLFRLLRQARILKSYYSIHRLDVCRPVKV